MQKHLFTLGFAALLAACNTGSSTNTGHTGADTSQNAAFREYEAHYLAALWKTYPEWATAVGFHEHDTVLVVPDSAAMEAELAFLQQQQDSLQSYDTSKLGVSLLTDYYLIRNQLEGRKWDLEKAKTYEWAPTSYNVIGTFASMLNENYAPLDERLRSFHARMANIPAFYAAAKKLIKDPVPELTSLAQDQHLGGLSIFEKDLADSLSKSGLSTAEKKALLDRAKNSGRRYPRLCRLAESAESGTSPQFQTGWRPV